MKHNHNHDNAPGTDQHTRRPVHFSFTHPTATSVNIAGSFNDWNPHSKAMHDAGNGHWSKESVLAPGRYEYRLVVDGEWMPDPLATQQVSNPFGGQNSVLTVDDVAETSRHSDGQ